MRGQFTLALFATASLTGLVSPALAQTTDAVEVSDEIVVTAQKREELLRDVPQSVTALTADTLERVQADNFGDYVGLVPGLSTVTSTPGSTRLTLRGLNTGGISPTVATYVDETPFGSSTALANGSQLALDLDPFDIQRIEVLRGPQGTLYGANALGGLIKFVTTEPSSDGFETRARTTAEATEDGEASWAVRGLVNIPLGDQAGLRISGLRRSQGGYIDDPTRSAEDINGAETTGGRVAFLLRATENLTFRISATGQDIESSGSSNVDYFPSPFAPVSGDLTQSRLFTEQSDVSYRIFNGTVDWDLGWAALTSSSSYNELDQNVLADTTVAIGGLPSHLNQDVATQRFTQEVRLVSPSSDRLEWLLGAYYNDEEASIFQEILFGPPPGTILLASASLESEYTESAAFGELTYHFTPRFDVSVGGRYAQNDQFAVTVLGPFTLAQESEDSVTTYSVAPRFQLSDQTTFYARVATGYRPGGPNVQSTLGTIPPTFGPDTTINYELGIKSDLIEGLLRLDASVFRIEWDDIQLLTTDGIVVGNTNAGTALSQGVEWAASLTPGENLSILWTGAYVDAHLTSPGDPILGGADGDPLPYAPEWTTAVDVDYRWSVFGTATAFVGGNWRYVGEQSSDFSPLNTLALGAPQVELPSYDIFNLRAGLDFDRFTIELFAKNVGDERAATTFGGLFATAPNTPGMPNGSAAIIRPRTIGVTLSARF